MVWLITYVNGIVFLCRNCRRHMRYKHVACLITIRQVIDKEDKRRI